MNNDIFLDKKDDSYYLLARPELKPFLPNGIEKMRVLEIGCGAGNFKLNIPICTEYWGVEPNLDAAERAGGVLDFIHVGIFPEVEKNLPNDYFDLVICNDVIEHMNDVDFFLSQIKCKMKQNGLIIGSIPNVRFIENILRFLILRDWKYTEWGILDKTHLRFFTGKSLVRLFRDNGYSIVKLHGINPVALKFSSIKSFFLNLILVLASFIFWIDSRYYQFGFQVKKR